ncbi:MAG: hypothetical protein HY925_00965 [Elusimicrobia bacterium]|nr:hypothetical protein [Elusimicrobiota bacterium]
MRIGKLLVALAAIAAVVLGGEAEAQNFVVPGEAVTVNVPIENASDSGAAILNVQVTITGGGNFATNLTTATAASITPGAAATLTPSFVVNPAAADGSYSVNVHTVIDDLGIDPQPTDIQVTFEIDTVDPDPHQERASVDSPPNSSTHTARGGAVDPPPSSGLSFAGFSGSACATQSADPLGATTAEFGAVPLSTGTCTFCAQDRAGNSACSTSTITIGQMVMSMCGTGPVNTKCATGHAVTTAQLLGGASFYVKTFDANYGITSGNLSQFCAQMTVSSPLGGGNCDLVNDGGFNRARRSFFGSAQSLAGASFQVSNTSNTAANFGINIELFVFDSLGNTTNPSIPFEATEYNPSLSDVVTGNFSVPEVNQTYDVPSPAGSYSASKYKGPAGSNQSTAGSYCS